MNTYPSHLRAVTKKAMRFPALAFFVCTALSAHAQSNMISGIAYGTNAIPTAVSIASLTNGAGTLRVNHPGTTDLTLNHDIIGSITISNDFTNFTIEASGSTVSNSTADALAIIGGNTLTLNGGNFVGVTQAESSVGGPPLPAPPSVAKGGMIDGTATVTISGTDFTGGAQAVTNGTSFGTHALVTRSNTTVTIQNLDSNISTLNGGTATSVNTTGTGRNAVSEGGIGLYAIDSFLVISNGTFTGGNAGSATADSDHNASAIGGSAIYATNSSVYIATGTFTGGNSGGARASGSGTTETRAGSALLAINSDVTIDGGAFSGGTQGIQTYFGLISQVDSGLSKEIKLNGGTFSHLGFTGAGIQDLIVGTNLVVEGSVIQGGGGLLAINNQTNSPFQHVIINNGTMIFENPFELTSEGSFNLNESRATATFSTLDLASGATFYVGEGTLNATTLNVESAATLWLTLSTNHTGKVSTTDIDFSDGAIIRIDGTTPGSGTNSLELITGNITIDQATATDSNIDNIQIETQLPGRTALLDVTLNSSQNLEFEFATQSWQNFWQATGAFGEFAGEFQDLLTPEQDALLSQLGSGSQSGERVEQTYLTTANSFRASLNSMLAAIEQSAARGAEVRAQMSLIPIGAKGPERNNDLRGWIKYYGQLYSHDEDQLHSGYESTQHGGMIGIDKSFGNLMLGISGGSGSTLTEYDNQAEDEISAVHGVFYSTYAAEAFYLDAGLAYGQNRVETRSAAPFQLTGEYDAELMGAYLGGGYNFIDQKGRTAFTPEASIHYTQYNQDAYTESGAFTPRRINAFDANSLRSSLGLNLSMLDTSFLKHVGFKMDTRMHWIHEFNPDPGNIDFQLIGGSAYQIEHASLDEDIYRLGIGFSFFNSEKNKKQNVMLRVDFDELFGENFNSHNVSTKVVYAF